MPDTPAAAAVPAVLPDPSDRIATLDILRGFALLGMIVVHFHQSFRLTSPESAHVAPESWIGWVVWVGIEEKAWGTFAFLFGVGFAVLMRRAERRGQPVAAFYLRRLAALAVIAIALEALTGFSVLLDYALWGVPLLVIRKWPAKVLLPIAVISAGSFSIVPLYQWATLGRDEADRAMTARIERAKSLQAPAPPSTYGDLVTTRLQRIGRSVTTWGVLFPTSSFALFIIGLLAVRHGIFDDPREHVRLIGIFMAIGFVSWVVAWWTEWWGWPLLPLTFGPQMVARVARAYFGIISEQWLAFTYIGALVLLLAFRPQWTQRLALFGIAGRMALSNYVLQCVVISLLASPFAFGLHLRPYYYGFGAILLFTVSALVSRAWLSRFRYGPLEWGWRSATYLRIPALLR